jgi:hypothetical protein
MDRGVIAFMKGHYQADLHSTIAGEVNSIIVGKE